MVILSVRGVERKCSGGHGGVVGCKFRIKYLEGSSSGEGTQSRIIYTSFHSLFYPVHCNDYNRAIMHIISYRNTSHHLNMISANYVRKISGSVLVTVLQYLHIEVRSHKIRHSSRPSYFPRGISSFTKLPLDVICLTVHAA